jgi:hypothetical protein
MLRISKLTFLNAVALPLAMGLGACFFGDDDGLDTGVSGTGGGQVCPTGGAGCPCTSQGACDPDLECVEQIGTCVVPGSCDIGSPGCECTAGGSCDEGYICMEMICVSEMPCLPDDTGTESCQCTMGGGCDPGLACLSNICVNVPATTTGETTGGDMTTGGQTTSGGTDTDATAGPTTSGDSVDGSSGG